MELILALTMVSVILIAGAVVLLSSGKQIKKSQNEVLAQQEMLRMFRMLEKEVPDILIDPQAKYKYTGGGSTVLCSGYMQTGSPCATCDAYADETWSYIYCTLQFNRKSKNETVIYSFQQDSSPSYSPPLYLYWYRDTYSAANQTQIGVGTLLQPYASADLDMNGVVTETEKITRDLCIDEPLPWVSASFMDPQNCWEGTPPVFPLFRVSADRKIIEVSVRSKFGKKGVTRAFYVQSAES